MSDESDAEIRECIANRRTTDAAIQFIQSGEAIETLAGRELTGQLLRIFQVQVGRPRNELRGKRTVVDMQGEARFLFRKLRLSMEDICERLPELTDAQLAAATAKSANGDITSAAKSAADKFSSDGFD